ncbi:ubiquitin domain-containing protein 2 [Limosa lapponica baueri]|uniref:Ubiquitin domain-containing protein 2 n=2 Tax=Neoaves TaxID=3078114 RepID=A0A2I0TVY4_LIMLA|nr:ubiquitin domain-containing protein 2 [Limosa lapponica baueri]
MLSTVQLLDGAPALGKSGGYKSQSKVEQAVKDKWIVLKEISRKQSNAVFIAYALTLMLVQLGKDIKDEEIPQQAYPIVLKINSLLKDLAPLQTFPTTKGWVISQANVPPLGAKMWKFVIAGALTECYDELGNRYQLPVYCLAPPINMIEEKGDLETLDIPDPPPNSGHECQLRLRLSTGKDLKLMVRSMDTVYHMKRRLHAVEGVEPGSQRWFFSGRPLADKMKLEELKIPKDYVVQVIVSQPLANPTPVEN